MTINSTMNIDKQLPSIYTLHQNYPNPFNPTTKINYDLPEDALVKVVVFDVMGRNVKTLMNEKSSGYHSLRWDATNDMDERHISWYVYLYHSSWKL